MIDMYTLFFDGACGPKNPGGTAAYGFTLHHGPDELAKESGVVGTGPEMSNNVAEYAGVTAGMSAMTNYIRISSPAMLTTRRSLWLQVFGDSKLVINQMSGLWAARAGLYYSYYERAQAVARELRLCGVCISFDYVPRAQNKVCDDLSKAYVKLT